MCRAFEDPNNLTDGLWGRGKLSIPHGEQWAKTLNVDPKILLPAPHQNKHEKHGFVEQSNLKESDYGKRRQFEERARTLRSYERTKGEN